MTHLHFRRPAFTLVLATLLMVITSCGTPDDEDIQEKVTKKLQENASTKGITATVKDGTVTLTGACEGENCAAAAEEKIKEVEGVKTVQNNIQKDEGTDLTLRTSVQSIISKYQGVQADVAAGVVVLRGSISRDQVQPLMNELQALQPKKIDNQLAVN